MLTKGDLGTIQTMIDKSLLANNEILMGRIVDVLKEFPTRAELHEELSKLATKEEVNQIKDDVAGLRSDLNTFMLSTEERFRVQGRDIEMIKLKLNLG